MSVIEPSRPRSSRASSRPSSVSHSPLKCVPSSPLPSSSSVPLQVLSSFRSPIERGVPISTDITTDGSTEPRVGSLPFLPLSVESTKNDISSVTAPSKNIQVVCRLRPTQNETGDRSFLPSHQKMVVASLACRTNGAFSFRGNSVHVCVPPSVSSSGGSCSGLGGSVSHDFSFDYVFGEQSSQKEIFERIGKPLVQSVCSGFNATLLAYGQSSSGKTYTIIGDRDQEDLLHNGNKQHDDQEKKERGELEENVDIETQERKVRQQLASTLERERAGDKAYACSRNVDEVSEKRVDRTVREGDGLLPRMIIGLFAWTKANENAAVKRCIRVAAIEIYNENTRDLISGRCGLKIQSQKQNRNSQGVIAIAGLEEQLIKEPSEAFSILEKAIKARRAATTRMNADSSRSHFVFCITLQEIVLNTGDSKVGRLTVVDLAGSERVAKTGSMGATLHEGSMINKSLTCLGKVIYALAALSEKNHDSGSSQRTFLPSISSSPVSSDPAPSSHTQQPSASASSTNGSFVPYRDSKLTRVLQDALGGNSNTCLILTCSQDVVHLSESISTLRFGQRAMCVKNSPKMNVKKAHEEEEFRYQKRHQLLESEYQAFASNVMNWAQFTILKFAQTQVRLLYSSRPPAVSRFSSLFPCENEAPSTTKKGNRLPRSRDKTRSRVIAFCQGDDETHLDSTVFRKKEHSEHLWSDIVEVLSAMPKPSVSLPLEKFDRNGFREILRQKVKCMIYGDAPEALQDTGCGSVHEDTNDEDREEDEEDEGEKDDKCESDNDDLSKKTNGAYRSFKKKSSALGFSTDDEEWTEVEETAPGGNGGKSRLNQSAKEGTSSIFSRVGHVTQHGEAGSSAGRVRKAPNLTLQKLRDEIETYLVLRQHFHHRQKHARSLPLRNIDSPTFPPQKFHSGYRFSHAQDVSSDRTPHIERAMRSFKENYLLNKKTPNELGASQSETKQNVKKNEMSGSLAAQMQKRSERKTHEQLHDQTILPIERKWKIEELLQSRVPSACTMEGKEREKRDKGQAFPHPVLKQKRQASGCVLDCALSNRETQKLQFPFVCHRRLRTQCLRQAVKKDDEIREQKPNSGDKKLLDSDSPSEEASETLWLWEKFLQLLEKEDAGQEENNDLYAYMECQDEHIKRLHNGVRKFLKHEKAQRRK